MKIIAISSTTAECLEEYRRVYYQWARLMHEENGFPVVQYDDNMLIQMALKMDMEHFRESIKRMDGHTSEGAEKIE